MAQVTNWRIEKACRNKAYTANDTGAAKKRVPGARDCSGRFEIKTTDSVHVPVEEGDTGTLEAEGFQAQVLDSLSPLPGLTVHRVRVTKGTARPGMKVLAKVDEASRLRSMCHHTATHLLNEALRQEIEDGTFESRVRIDGTVQRLLEWLT